MITLQTLADRVAQGGVVEQAEAPVVFGSHDLIAIGMMADDVRRQLHGAATTFLRVFEIHVDAVPATLPAGVEAGEFRLVGRPASLDAARAATERARTLVADAVLSGFSLADVAAWGGGAFERLATSGLDAIAEVTIDGAEGASIQTARAAGLLVQRLIVHQQPHDPLESINAARELQEAVGGFRAFAPLPRAMTRALPTTGYDDVKLVAVARVMIRTIPSIQVDWPLYGPKLAQVALTVGADDVDGIAAVESGSLGPRRSPLEEIKGNIRAAGLQAIERDGRFEVRRR